MTHANKGKPSKKHHWLGLLSSLIVGFGLLAPAQAIAQDFPNKAITVIVPHAAGSQPDTIMRRLALTATPEPELEPIEAARVVS